LEGVEGEDAARLPDDGESDEIATRLGNVAVDPGAEPLQTSGLAEVLPPRKEPEAKILQLSDFEVPSIIEGYGPAGKSI
jgi:hypothetical protein